MTIFKEVTAQATDEVPITLEDSDILEYITNGYASSSTEELIKEYLFDDNELAELIKNLIPNLDDNTLEYLKEEVDYWAKARKIS